MVEIGKQFKDLRFWGFGVAAKHCRSKLTKQIKAAGLKHSGYGMSKHSALESAQRVEEVTGIKMEIFNHDYL